MKSARVPPRARGLAGSSSSRLVARVEATGLSRLGAAELSRLPVLYRATLSSLSVARAISLDANVLEYLESLAARAYVCVYGASAPPLEAARRFLSERFPATVRSLRRQLALSAALLVLGTLTGLGLTATDPDALLRASSTRTTRRGGRPRPPPRSCAQALYDDKHPADLLGAFAMFLFTHNAKVGMLCAPSASRRACRRCCCCSPTGCSSAPSRRSTRQRGLGIEFWAWILPHGVTELLAVVLCGAAAWCSARPALPRPPHAARTTWPCAAARPASWCWARS